MPSDNQDRPQRVIQFEYQQSLAFASNRAGWSESYTISVRILSEAITSGWYAKNFGKHALDFVVLITIVMHSRPLLGDDLEMLIRLGLATKEDEGRLYARITDRGLAAELEVHRTTIAVCAERLAAQRFINITEIPEGTAFRDSHGQFEGTKVFLVSGELQNLLQKGIDLNHRVGFSDTVIDLNAHRVGKTDTVKGDLAPHRVSFSDNHIGKTDTNIDVVDSAEGEVNGATAAEPLPIPEQIFAFFAQRKGDANYAPSQKEIAALDTLLLDGFTFEQIVSAIETAFTRPSKPRYFTLCANITREIARNPNPETRVLEARHPETNHQPEARKPGTCQQTDVISSIEPELAQAVEIYRSGGRELTEDVLARLRRMADRCSQVAQASDGKTGAAWVADALELAQGNADPKSLLNYADKVLKGWIKLGRNNNRGKGDEHDDAIPPEIAIFQEATSRTPLRDQRAIVIRAIRDHGFTTDDLRPFWEAHVARDKKRSDLTWLLDWAVKGAVPNAAGFARPSGLDQMAQTLQILSQKGE